jgi:hypothetical protein
MRATALVGALVGILLAAQAGTLRGEPGKQTEAERIASLIKQLGDDDFAQREQASKELDAMGESAVAALRKAAASSDDLEIRRRAEQVIGSITARTAKKELAKFQGTWQVRPDGTKVIIEAEKWTWITPGYPTASGTLRVVEIGAERTKVEWVHDTGPRKGFFTQAIMHLRDADTLQYHGRGNWEGDDYPADFKGIHACTCNRIPK